MSEATPYTPYILENLEQQDLTPEQATALEDAGKIFWCEDCECYHISMFDTWESVDEALKNVAKKP